MPSTENYQRQRRNDPTSASPRTPDASRPTTHSAAAVMGGRPETTGAAHAHNAAPASQAGGKGFSDFVTLDDFQGPQSFDLQSLLSLQTPNYANPTPPYEGDPAGLDPPPSHFDLSNILRRRI